MGKKILLISGHGAGDPGATATIKKKIYKEADETIVMVNKIKSQLDSYDATVDIYPTSRNAYEDAKAGKLKMDMDEYDYVLEIHFNACVNDLKGNGKVTGSEAYITTSDKSKTTESNILSNLASLGLKNRGIKSHNYTVIQRAKTSGADSCLLEVCFIDDADDMQIYLNDKNAVASQIAKGVVAGLGLKKKVVTANTTAQKTTSVLKAGSKVKIKSGALDLNTGKKYSSFVYKTVYTVISVKGDYVIFGLKGVATGKTKKSNCIVQ